MRYSDKAKLLKDIEGFHLPEYNEIPNVGLYLEQTSKYITEVLSPLCENAITGSMISNYVKKGLINNPVKKQYDREQIAQLIFIAVVKTVLSMDDIMLTLDIREKAYKTEKAYTYFAKELESVIADVFLDKPIAKQTNAEFPDEKRVLRNIIITVAYKIYLEKYFDLMG